MIKGSLQKVSGITTDTKSIELKPIKLHERFTIYVMVFSSLQFILFSAIPRNSDFSKMKERDGCEVPKNQAIATEYSGT